MAQNNKAMSLENTKQYIKGVLQGWFSNKATLDKLSTATNGDLLYDNQPVGSGSGGSITVDDALSDTSENPVQNKVIYAALQNTGSIPYTLPPATITDLGGIIVGDNLTIDANGRLSADEQSIILDVDEVDHYDPDTNELVLVDADGDVTRRIDLTPTGGYGSNVVVDDSLSDTSENSVQNKVVKSALDGKQDVLTFDSAPTENSLNPVTSGGVYAALQDQTTYELPVATSSILGGIKIGAGLEIDANGVLRVVGFQKIQGQLSLSKNVIELDEDNTSDTIEVINCTGDISATISDPSVAIVSVSGRNVEFVWNDKAGETTATITSNESLNYLAKIESISVICRKQMNIVSWSDGTDDEIRAMLDAHYNGDINIHNYWSPGDVRVVNFESWDTIYSGNKNVVLVNAGGMTLTNDTECAFVWQISSPITTNRRLHNVEVVVNYSQLEIRSWLNNTFYPGLPTGFKNLCKKYIYRVPIPAKAIGQPGSWDNLEEMEDWVSLPPYREVLKGYNTFADYTWDNLIGIRMATSAPNMNADSRTYENNKTRWFIVDNTGYQSSIGMAKSTEQLFPICPIGCI